MPAGFRFAQFGLIVSAVWFVCLIEPASAIAPELGSVSLESVSYKQLGDVIRANRGKVVVVDVWASYCKPCKKEFPGLVQLHRRYAADGLVCLSVSVDDATASETALKFLTEQKATFGNYRLQETPDVWTAKWKVNGIPLVFVFDRDGNRAAKFDSDDESRSFGYDKDVEPLVRKLLQDHPGREPTPPNRQERSP